MGKNNFFAAMSPLYDVATGGDGGAAAAAMAILGGGLGGMGGMGGGSSGNGMDTIIQSIMQNNSGNLGGALGRPQYRAKGGSVKLKKAAQQLKKKGRFGDSELVHVNPAEKKMLEDMAGGITTKNPDTGLDEHFWSVLIPAGIGALTGAMRGGGLKGALKGALLGGATAGLGAGIGGLASGEGFMTGLGTMFGGAGQGVNGLGSLLGYDTGGVSNAVDAAGFAKYPSPIGPIGIGGTSGAANLAAATAANAPVGAAEQTLMGDVGKFLKTPQGLIAASGALGMLTDDGKDPYGDEKKKRDAEQKNYARYDNGMRNLTQYASGGQVRGYDAGGAVFDQNNPAPLGVGSALNFNKLQPYTVPASTAPATSGAAGIGNFGKEVYTPKVVSPEELAAKAAIATNGIKADSWISPNGQISDMAGRAYNMAMIHNMQGGFQKGMKSYWTPEMLADWTDQDYVDAGYKKYASGGKTTKRDVPMDSDVTRQLRQNPNAQMQFAKEVKEMEKKIGRRLDNDEAIDLMERMGGGIGQMMPAYAKGGPVAGIGSGKSDDIPAMLSDGEHVITADEVSMLGDGSNNAGHKKLYSMRKKLRKHKTGRTKQMPKAKTPESYAGVGA